MYYIVPTNPMQFNSILCSDEIKREKLSGISSGSPYGLMEQMGYAERTQCWEIKLNSWCRWYLIGNGKFIQVLVWRLRSMTYFSLIGENNPKVWTDMAIVHFFRNRGVKVRAEREIGHLKNAVLSPNFHVIIFSRHSKFLHFFSLLTNLITRDLWHLLSFVLENKFHVEKYVIMVIHGLQGV